METEVYLVRHAHSIYTLEERSRPLSEKGRKEADKVTDSLTGVSVDHVVSSPYLRAVQTVEGVALERGLPIRMVEGLRERQLAEGAVQDFDTAIHKVWTEPGFAWPGGESNDSAQQRGVAAFEDVIKHFEGGTIVIGTHGNLMVLIMNYYDPQCGFEFWKQLTMPDIYRLTFNGLRMIGCERMWQDL
ncbi:histidine phosphatase family protein [Indiicoccus explosivorum]|uniref:histidine phosphatase family protein n=1 Tax=Indiicoccus explosivorum TaxID=1917864 RepID=UPI000B43E7EE|nr:histidine phosphatase family protein [Indiicoccus explosivorum]